MPATNDQIQEARKILESKWDSEGDCSSCGWHALLGEYDIEDSDIADCLNNANGILYLGCLSEDEDNWGHRGTKICIRTK